MSARKLISLLKELGYEKANELRSDDLEYMYKDDEMARFLDFLVANTTKEANFVTTEEQNRFEELKKKEGIINNVEELEELLATGDFSDGEAKLLTDEKTLQLHSNQLDAAKRWLERLGELETNLNRYNNISHATMKQKAASNNRVTTSAVDELKNQMSESCEELRANENELVSCMKTLKTSLGNPSKCNEIIFGGEATKLYLAHSIDNLNLLASRIKLLKNNDGTKNSGDAIVSETEIKRLRDLLVLAYREWCLQNMRLIDYQERLRIIQQLEANWNESSVENLRDQCNDKTTAAMRAALNEFVQQDLPKYAAVSADNCINEKSLQQLEMKLAEITKLTEMHEQFLEQLQRHIAGLQILEVILNQEERLLRDNVLAPITNMDAVFEKLARHGNGLMRLVRHDVSNPDSLELPSEEESSSSNTTLSFANEISQIVDGCNKIAEIRSMTESGARTLARKFDDLDAVTKSMEKQLSVLNREFESLSVQQKAAKAERPSTSMS